MFPIFDKFQYHRRRRIRLRVSESFVRFFELDGGSSASNVRLRSPLPVRVDRADKHHSGESGPFSYLLGLEVATQMTTLQSDLERKITFAADFF